MKPERLKWTPELVSKFWDGFSQTELTKFSFAKQAGPTLLTAIGHLLPRDGEIVDFGAGDGDLVRMLCERGFAAAAYEPSQGRTEALTRALADTAGFLGVIDKHSSRQFDLVIMSEVIEHVLDEELDATLTRLADLTKPGGRLIVTTPNNEDLELGMCYCPVGNLLFHRWQHVRSFTDETLAALLARFGFKEVVTHRLGFDPAVFACLDPWRLSAAAKPQAAASIMIDITPDVAANTPPPLPDYIVNLLNSEKALIGSQSNLLYVGVRI